MAFGKEIKRIREATGITSAEMADLFGIESVERYRNWEKRDIDPPKHEDRKLIESFFKMDLPAIFKLDKIPDELLNKKYGNNRLEKGAFDTVLQSVPLYDVEFSAGFTQVIRDLKPGIIANITIPEVQGCDFIVRAKGDSMIDFINDRDWIGIKKIEDKSVINYGNPYAIITSELQLIKYIRKSNQRGYFLLRSHNKEYDDFDLSVSKIIELYIIKVVLPFSKIKTLN